MLVIYVCQWDRICDPFRGPSRDFFTIDNPIGLVVSGGLSVRFVSGSHSRISPRDFTKPMDHFMDDLQLTMWFWEKEVDNNGLKKGDGWPEVG